MYGIFIYIYQNKYQLNVDKHTSAMDPIGYEQWKDEYVHHQV